ncbi:MAG TPA: LuxR C-terminal-related transcriptional regulator [Noviherbaspirillum sp.]
MSLNRTKFHPSLSSHGGVLRDRLLRSLGQEANVHLVLLLAPAGYGKSTLMGQWMEHLRQEGIHTTWLTLDEADNDPARFMRYLYGALAEWMEAALGTIEPADMPASSDWMSLLDRIGPDAPPLTVFIDEFEKLTNAPALRLAKLLVDRLPRQVRVVISSRDKPAVGLERYRVRGELLELTAGNLRFDQEETQQFFKGRIGEPLGGWLIEKMQAITDGWPAALQFTALAARSQTELERYARNLSGNLAHIADYLAEDVLNAQTPEVRTFLLETCSLPRLSAAVCNAATGRTDSQRMLQYLERRGLFTTPLDSDHTWFRYHPLFAEFLQGQQALALPPEQVVAIHRGAARWFSRHGTAIEAVDIWLLAGETMAAIREMTACARELVMQAQFGTILRWVDRLDETSLQAAGPELLVAAAWACGFGGVPDAAVAWLTRLKPILEARGIKDALYDEMIVLDSILLALRGDTRSALERGLEHWQRVSRGHRFAAGALANVISYCLMLEGDFTRARSFSDDARLCNEEIGSALGLGYALSVSGLIEAMQGRLDQALEQFQEVDRMAALKLRRQWFETTHVNVATAGLIASILYEKDRLDEAEELLQRYLPLLMHQPSLDMLLLSHVIRARLKLAQGDVDAAIETLDRARHHTAAGWQVARAHRVLDWERVHIDLFAGRSERALARADLLERAALDESAQTDCLYVEELFGRGMESIRCAIVRGDVSGALSRLDVEIAEANAKGRRWRQLKLTLLRVLALDAAGHTEARRGALTEALRLGARIGARRSFADEGKRMKELLAQLPPHAIAATRDTDAVVRFWQDLCGERPPHAETPSTVSASLSERERAILGLLATGMGNEQIAGSIFLSVNTVKWHIRRILEKLEARNRSEAVFIARRLGLIEM